MRISPAYDTVYVLTAGQRSSEYPKQYECWLAPDYWVRELTVHEDTDVREFPEFGVFVYHEPQTKANIREVEQVLHERDTTYQLVVVTGDEGLATEVATDEVKVVKSPPTESAVRQTVYTAALYLEYEAILKELYRTSLELAQNGDYSGNREDLEIHCEYLRGRADALVQSFSEHDFVAAFRTIRAKQAAS